MSLVVVLFDGPCTLCNKSVDWITCRDFYGNFHFASLQSKWAAEHLPEHLKSEDSVVLFMHGQFHIRSKAALLILEQLPGYRWTKVFHLVPTFLLDLVYRIIAKTRYRFFGKGYCTLVSGPRMLD
ncbi:MAG: DCC1-like thiol-disulfide oxidoreductase family protein [Cryomorphaceae bacterium]